MRRLGGERRRFLTTLGLFIALFRSLRVRRGRGGVTIAFLSRFCGFGFFLTTCFLGFHFTSRIVSFFSFGVCLNSSIVLPKYSTMRCSSPEKSNIATKLRLAVDSITYLPVFKKQQTPIQTTK